MKLFEAIAGYLFREYGIYPVHLSRQLYIGSGVAALVCAAYAVGAARPMFVTPWVIEFAPAVLTGWALYFITAYKGDFLYRYSMFSAFAFPIMFLAAVAGLFEDFNLMINRISDAGAPNTVMIPLMTGLTVLVFSHNLFRKQDTENINSSYNREAPKRAMVFLYLFMPLFVFRASGVIAWIIREPGYENCCVLLYLVLLLAARGFAGVSLPPGSPGFGRRGRLAVA